MSQDTELTFGLLCSDLFRLPASCVNDRRRLPTCAATMSHRLALLMSGVLLSS